MIFKEVVLHNYGIYGGRQSLDLSPVSSRTPITLLGGINGGGKTTLLDGIQLALYGKQARCSNRGSLPYSEYLKKCINETVSPSDGAAVEVEFQHRHLGEEHTYRIHRSWTDNGKGARERLEVLLDGEYDENTTERWQEVIDDFLPVGISHLFFFDGEQIENFAEPAASAELLSTAIHSLLGIDLVDQLGIDLLALAKRKRIQSKTVDERQAILETEAKHSAAVESREALVQKRASAQNDLDLAVKKLHEAEARFSAQGGDIFEKRHQLETERQGLADQLASMQADLRKAAYEGSPLLLVEPLLDGVLKQTHLEERAKQAILLGEVLADRDEQTLEQLSRLGAGDQKVRGLRAFLEAERNERAKEAQASCYLYPEPEDVGLLSGFLAAERTSLVERIQDLLAQASKIKMEIENKERTLAAIPEQDAIAKLIAERELCKSQVLQAEGVVKHIDQEIAVAERAQEGAKVTLSKALEKTARSELERRDLERVVGSCGRATATLQVFRRSVVLRHIKRLEGFILESFQYLLRKKTLINRIEIDPGSFVINLYGADGAHRTPDRLSAGERQLLALSIMWGLARASGRRLPLVIDTPLGRLDSAHRTNAVERYFPHASHQVLLLSTDEEINRSYFRLLKPAIGRTYFLDYRDALGTTVIRDGYFWKD